MDSLRWWLLLLAAVMFSMSGCASKQEWNEWASHPTHYASGNHWEFSQRTGGDIDPRIITPEDQANASKEGWWGDLVPQGPTADFAGNWVGTWKGLGLFDSLRTSDARMTLMQSGIVGAGQIYLSDTIAAGVPWSIRYAGSNGVRLGYRVRGSDAEMREVGGAGAPMVLAFTRIDDKLVGTVVGGLPVVITLTKAPVQSAAR